MPEFLEVAIGIAQEAGRIMLEHFALSVRHSFKEDHSPLTDADKKINDLVIKRIETYYPEHSLIGEEGSRMKPGPHTWVFDPIDGTAAFLRGIPTNVFSLALVERGSPILGVVYDPYLDRLYRAGKGMGAFLNDAPLRTSLHTELSGSYVETDGQSGFTNLEFLNRAHDARVRFLSYSSTVYAHMLVASGQIEGVIYPLTKPWDAAAAKILVEEAGGVVSDVYGAEQRYDAPIQGCVSACTREFHSELLSLIKPSV